jgi:WD40 repeat protein
MADARKGFVMRKMVLVLVGLLLLLGVMRVPVGGRGVSAQDGGGVSETSSDAPYIYYYSEVLNAFVVERADGSGSRLLAQGMMDGDESWFSGPGWSPSGEWFAWTAGRWAAHFVIKGAHPYVVGVDDSRPAGLPGDFNDVSMQWSPTEDVLFIAGAIDPETTHDSNREGESTNRRIALYDPASEQFLATVNDVFFDHNSHRDAVPEIAWRYDGAYALAAYTRSYSVYDPSEQPRYYVMFDRSGSVVRRATESDIFGLIYRHDPAANDRLWTGFVRRLDAGTGEPIIEDLVTGDQLTTSQYISLLRERGWWPDYNRCRTFGFTHNDEEEICTTRTFLGLILGHTLELLRQTAGEFVRMPEFIEQIGVSPDGRYVAYAESDTLHLLRVQTQALNSFDIELGDSPEWWWTDKGQLVIHPAQTRPDEAVTFTVIELTDVQRHYQFDPRFPTLTVSPNGQRLLWEEGYVEGTHILDVTTGEMQVFRPHANSFRAISNGRAIWHEAGDWVFSNQNATRAGGVGCLDYIGIIGVEQGIRRDFGRYCGDVTPYGWLPARVDVARLPPVEPVMSPVLVLERGSWTYDLSWSPDGNYIAAGRGWYEAGDTLIHVWEVTTGELVASFEARSGFHNSIFWRIGEDGEYEAYTAPPEDHGYLPATALSPDGRYLARETQQPEVPVVVFDLHEPERVFLLRDAIAAYTVVMAFSSSGDLFAYTSQWDENIWIYETETWELVGRVNVDGFGFAFSPDGTQLAVAASWDIHIYNVADILAQGQGE